MTSASQIAKTLTEAHREVCDCHLCERGREFDRRVKRLSPDARAFFVAIYDALLNAEFDLDVYQASDG